MAGRLTAAQFIAETQAFQEAWKPGCGVDGAACEAWQWEPGPPSLFQAPGGGFLKLQRLLPSTVAEAGGGSIVPLHELLADEEAAEDPTALANGATAQQLEFNIVYHPSYQVPVLYFRSQRPDGASLGLVEVVDLLPAASQLLASSPVADRTFLTQQEHPVLGTPWFLLHPCQTAEFMALLLSEPAANSATAGATSKATSETCTVQPAEAESDAPPIGLLNRRIEPPVGTYLAAWFSVVGPAVGLQLPRGMWVGSKKHH